jgi:acyl-coenzyme A thioesterase PaaI-like protein
MPYSNAIPWIAGAADRTAGMELEVGWDGTEAVLDLVVPGAAQAAPGVAHGGFLATLADHVMGFVAAQQDGRPAVTRQMTVDYVAPTPTSERLILRARAESVTDSTVIVMLEAGLDADGRVTFRARGDYARVSPTRRHARGTPADYDSLEERFDPSQIFSWLVDALTGSYVPAALGSPVVLALEIADVTPRQWTLRATAESLTFEAGDAAEWDVHFAGPMKSWRQMVYRRKTAEQILAAGEAAIDDPRGLLPALLAALGT